MSASNRFAIFSSELSDLPESEEHTKDFSDGDEWDTDSDAQSDTTPVSPAMRPIGAFMQKLIGGRKPPAEKPLQLELPPLSSEPDLIRSSPIRGTAQEQQRLRRKKGQVKRKRAIQAKVVETPGPSTPTSVHPYASVFDGILGSLAQRGIPFRELVFYVFDPAYKQGITRKGFFQSTFHTTRLLDIFGNLKQARDVVAQWAYKRTALAVRHEARDLTASKVLQTEDVKLDDQFFLGFDLPKLKNKLKSAAPVTVQIFTALATSPKYVNSYGPQRLAKKSNVIYTTMLQNLSEFSQKNNIFKKIISAYMYATGASRQPIEVMSHLGLSESYTSLVDKKRKRKRKPKKKKEKSKPQAGVDASLIDDITIDEVEAIASGTEATSVETQETRPGSLRSLSGHMKGVARGIAATGLFGTSYDNINLISKAAEQILGRTDAQENGTCATVFVLWAASLEDMKTSDLRKMFDTAPGLTLLDILHKKEEAELFRRSLIHCILRIIITHGGEAFTQFQANMERTQPVSDFKIDVHKTQLYPTPAWMIDESSINGNSEFVEQLFKYLGLHGKPEFDRYVRILAGDQLSIARLRSIVNIRAGQEGGFSSLGWGAWMPGLFHGKIADTHGFFNTHWGKPNTGGRNPGSLWFHNTILHRLPITLTSLPTFRTCRDLIFTSLYARILNCLLIVSGCESLDDYVTPTTTFEVLYSHAETIYDCFTSTAKVEELRHERQRAESAGIDPVTGKKGDMVFENALLFLRDALISREYSDAIKAGDSGRVLLVLKTWALSFCGNGRTKYVYEMLSIIHHLTHVWPKPLCRIILNNWLLNPSGHPNSFVEVDLMQEHMNFWIKNFYRAHGSNASWGWLEIIAPCVTVLRHLTKNLNGLLRADLGTKHAPPDLGADIDALMSSLMSRDVYKVCPGRVLDDDETPVVDVVTAGLQALVDGAKSPITEYNTAFRRLQARSRLTPLVPVQAASPAPVIPTAPSSISLRQSSEPSVDSPQVPSTPRMPRLPRAKDDTTMADDSDDSDGDLGDDDEHETEFTQIMDIDDDEPTLELAGEEDLALDMDSGGGGSTESDFSDEDDAFEEYGDSDSD